MVVEKETAVAAVTAEGTGLAVRGSFTTSISTRVLMLVVKEHLTIVLLEVLLPLA